MGDTTARHPITLKRIVRSLEGMERVEVTRNVTYHEDLRLDVYHPSRSQDAAAPAVVIVAGYRDVGVPLTLGCNFREMEFVVSLAQLIAASGMAAIAYSTSAPAGDAGRVVDYIARSGGELGIDPARLGIWAASGNVPVALGLLMERRPGIRAAVLSNGYTFDGPHGAAVAEAAADLPVRQRDGRQDRSRLAHRRPDVRRALRPRRESRTERRARPFRQRRARGESADHARQPCGGAARVRGE